ncbi:MAG: DUF2393 family protein [Sulfuricurvum sp.]|uniref:DUF2393 family protein n=2 Tax=Sulfuricurvum sp. TaxID=2025608 RepID=UPI002625B990|nr:DUF2393 family protein [Sulfuricurvum sp.]MDD2838183.1 DUF2393 family protein [Sulfuricurvum sp.]MDD3596200.1 DUF2393 family protein [Sulfuricurvum sp.]
MSTYLTIWHYSALLIGLLVFLITVLLAFNEQRSSIRNSIIFSSLLVNLMVGFIVMMALDKYTKIAKVYNLDNHRLLQTEQIVFTGVVKNEGSYTIGKVELEIKLVNRGHVSGNVKGGNFFKASGFADMFGNASKDYQPQTLIETPILAENLKPGESRRFRVVFDYPPYFKGVTQFTRIFAH